jgi:hypothetical protein
MILRPISMLATSASAVPEFISSSIENAATLTTMPSHQSGDLLIGFAVRGGLTIPSIPSGWTTLSLTTTSSHRTVGAYKVASSSSEVSGTWTNGIVLGVVVFRGASAVGEIEYAGGGRSYADIADVLNLVYPAWTASASGSLLLAVGSHRDPSAATWSDAPTADVEQDSYLEGSNGNALVFHVSPGAVSESAGGSVVAVASNHSYNYAAGFMIEIKA